MEHFAALAFSSKSDDWPTPLDFFRKTDEEFGFTLDVCASPENAKCARFYTKAEDGLTQAWNGTVWCNPPYGRGIIGPWVKRAAIAATEGTTVVVLVPARTDTAWWHDWATKATEIRYIRGRLRFGDGKYPAPFPSALLVFRGTA